MVIKSLKKIYLKFKRLTVTSMKDAVTRGKNLSFTKYAITPCVSHSVYFLTEITKRKQLIEITN